MSTNNESTKLLVYQAIANVSKALQVGIAKDKSAPQYKFRGVDDFLAALSPELSNHNLILIPYISNHKTDVTLVEKPAYGSNPAKMQRVTKATLDLVVKAICTADGSQTTIVVPGEGDDYGDKATAKAISMAWKYLAIYTFCIPTDNVEDSDYSNQAVKSVAEKDESEERKRLLSAIAQATTKERLSELEPYANQHGCFSELTARKMQLVGGM